MVCQRSQRTAKDSATATASPGAAPRARRHPARRISGADRDAGARHRIRCRGVWDPDAVATRNAALPAARLARRAFTPSAGAIPGRDRGRTCAFATFVHDTFQSGDVLADWPLLLHGVWITVLMTLGGIDPSVPPYGITNKEMQPDGADVDVAKLIKRYPDQKFEVKFAFRKGYFGIGLRRGDPDFRRWLNTWVFFNMANGKLSAIAEKWEGVSFKFLPTF